MKGNDDKLKMIKSQKSSNLHNLHFLHLHSDLLHLNPLFALNDNQVRVHVLCHLF